MRSNIPPKNSREAGQALPLFGLMIFVLLGFAAMSVDVGRYVWARTSMQAGVDAAALAAAQSMPSQTNADAKAVEYWIDNSGFIQSQGTNVQFTVSYPPGNKAIKIEGAADIPTWFAKFFGVPKWHVTAEGQAESQVLDIAVVLDISGSMCYDPPMLHIETSESTLNGPGHFSPASSRPVLVDGVYTGAGDNSPQDIPSGGSSPITIKLNTVSGFSVGDRIVIHTGLNGAGSYEIFKIRSSGINTTNKSLYLDRSQTNNFTNTSTSKLSHVVGAEIWQNWGNSCSSAVRGTTAPWGANPFDGTVAAAEYFTTLFNPSYDKIGVAKYSTNSASVTSLSSNLSSVKNQIHNLVPPSGSTNIAGGLAAGRLIVDGSGKRANAVKVIVLLTDGIANYVCGNNSAYATSDYNNLPCSSTYNPNSTNTSQSHAYSEAQRAANGDIIIFTIGLGNDVDSSFLERLADGGTYGVGACQNSQPGCRYFHAPTTAQLDAAFQAIAEQTHIALVK